MPMVRKRRSKRSGRSSGSRPSAAFRLPWGKLAGVAVSLAVIALITYVPANRFFNNLSLFYHYLVPIGLIVALALAALSKSARAAALILAVALLFSYGQGGFQDMLRNGGAGASVQPPLKVATYNWRVGNQNFDAFASWVKTEQPDIISIQELSKVYSARYIEIESLYPYRTDVRPGDDVQIISRYPLENSAKERVGNRQLVHTQVRTPQGLVDFYAIHPQTVVNEDVWISRNSYLEIASEVISPRSPYVFVAGDFNASTWDPYYRKIVAGNGLHAEPRLFAPVTRVLGIAMGANYGAPIDHILAGENIHISGCRTGPSMGSDHLPVICLAMLKPVN